jgi:hypothetical protein
MQIEITKKSATTFMRWVIVLALFGTVIYQSNRIDELKQQLDSMTKMENGIHEDWYQAMQDLRDLHSRCGQ